MKTPRNKFESRIYKALKKSKVSFQYESEKIAYIWSGHYTPDFILTTPTGKIYIETKGYFRPEDKRKLVSVKRCNPQLDIRLLFYAPNKQNERWAVRHNFKYAVEHIPKEWLHGL